MTSKSTFILSLIFLLFSASLFAQEQGKDVTITASGSGSTQSEAQQMALRSATEQAFGAFISSKTEIFNDQLVADQMSSVSSGNIKSFEVLSESQLPNGTWASTIKAIVSVDKLTSFVQAKGVAVEIQGGLFAINIKQQKLNEDGEYAAVVNLFETVRKQIPSAYDFTVETLNPVSVPSGNSSETWAIQIKVIGKANSNHTIINDYIIKTLREISMSKEEQNSYKTLGKPVDLICMTRIKELTRSDFGGLRLESDKKTVKNSKGNIVGGSDPSQTIESNKLRKDYLKWHEIQHQNTLILYFRNPKSKAHIEAQLRDIKSNFANNFRITREPAGANVNPSNNKTQKVSIYGNQTRSDYKENIDDFMSPSLDVYHLGLKMLPSGSFGLLEKDLTACVFEWFDYLSLEEISSLNGYSVKPNLP
jgi:hypothetical protein